ncbi:MAG: YwqG family protein [Cyanobacteria bacterium P01_A01_bin.123]
MEERLIELISKYELEDLSESILKEVYYGILVSRDTSEMPRTRDSKFGGLPLLPVNFSYPTHKGRPLDFILQLNCKDLVNLNVAEPLPESGFLYFFYDSIEQPLGHAFDDIDGSLVAYVSESETLQPYQHPVGTDNRIFIESKLKFDELLTLPNPSIFDNVHDIEAVARYLNLLTEWREIYLKGEPHHQILGTPTELHGSMQEICDLASTGRTYPKGNKRGKYYVDKSSEWRLLFQIDSNIHHADLPGGFCWGDFGRLFAWIRESDLRDCNFKNAWTVLEW